MSILPKKKKLEKWPFLDPNHGFTPLETCQFFDFLNFFFYSLERHFFVLKNRKRHFPALYCLKNKLEKRPFSDLNHGLTRLEKCQFFDFLNFLFLYPIERHFFVLEYRKRNFPGLYCLKKRVGKMAIF